MKTPPTINELPLVRALKLTFSNGPINLKGGTEKQSNGGIAASNLQREGDRRHHGSWILCIISRNNV